MFMGRATNMETNIDDDDDDEANQATKQATKQEILVRGSLIASMCIVETIQCCNCVINTCQKSVETKTND